MDLLLSRAYRESCFRNIIPSYCPRLFDNFRQINCLGNADVSTLAGESEEVINYRFHPIMCVGYRRQVLTIAFFGSEFQTALRCSERIAKVAGHDACEVLELVVMLF